jgi:hypothetical protein
MAVRQQPVQFADLVVIQLQLQLLVLLGKCVVGNLGIGVESNHPPFERNFVACARDVREKYMALGCRGAPRVVGSKRAGKWFCESDPEELN